MSNDSAIGSEGNAEGWNEFDKLLYDGNSSDGETSSASKSEAQVSCRSDSIQRGEASSSAPLLSMANAPSTSRQNFDNQKLMLQGIGEGETMVTNPKTGATTTVVTDYGKILDLLLNKIDEMTQSELIQEGISQNALRPPSISRVNRNLEKVGYNIIRASTFVGDNVCFKLSEITMSNNSTQRGELSSISHQNFENQQLVIKEISSRKARKAIVENPKTRATITVYGNYAKLLECLMNVRSKIGLTELINKDVTETTLRDDEINRMNNELKKVGYEIIREKNRDRRVYFSMKEI